MYKARITPDLNDERGRKKKCLLPQDSQRNIKMPA